MARPRPQFAREGGPKLSRKIAAVHSASGGTYGRPRIHMELRAMGVLVGEKRVGRLMKSGGIHAVSRRSSRTTTNSRHSEPIAPNIVERAFEPATIGGVDRVWAGDITYIPTREGWLYLAVVLDLYSRRVIGWSMGTRLFTELAADALLAAVRLRKPAAGVVFHSDRGVQYAATEYRAILAAHGMRQSMSGKGDCWDNAVVESFFGTMKSELGDPVYETRAEARAAIFKYIEGWYNLRRRHSTLGYVSPIQFESPLPIAA